VQITRATDILLRAPYTHSVLSTSSAALIDDLRRRLRASCLVRAPTESARQM